MLAAYISFVNISKVIFEYSLTLVPGGSALVDNFSAHATANHQKYIVILTNNQSMYNDFITGR